MNIGINTYTNLSKTNYLYNSYKNKQVINNNELKNETKYNNNFIPLNQYIGNLGFNISFTGGKISPIYAIDKQGNYQKFSTQKEAAEKLNLLSSDISNVITGIRKTVSSYTFVRAEEVETKDENGNVTVDQEKIKRKLANAEREMGKKKSVYAIDEQGNYQKFTSITDAEEALNIQRNRISAVISDKNKSRSADGYTFVRAEDVETEDNSGNVTVDTKIIQEKAKGIKKVKVGCKGTPLYAIDKKGNYQRFNSQNEAAEKLHMYPVQISSVITGKAKSSGGYVFVQAKDIETQDDNGIAVVDTKSLKKIIDKIQKSNDTSLYAIDLDGNYKKYNNRTEAAQNLNISTDQIQFALAAEFGRRVTGGYLLVQSEDIETTDENGNITVNTQKIKEVTDKVKKHKDKSVYVIDRNGNYQKFNSKAEVAQAFNTDKKHITDIMAQAPGMKNINGYALARTEDIETEDVNGNITIDNKIMQKIIEILNKKIKFGI